MTRPADNAPREETDLLYMKLALREARKGLGRTSPNPCVGAVVVREDEIVARGYHRRAGTPHAEVNALDQAGSRARGATLYVTLEPCNHTGRTPPCTERILASGIKRVVVGMDDPNPLVTGDGNAYLAGHGLVVSSGILAEDCRELNQPFIKHITTGQPLVIMKAGLSMDGRISAGKGLRTRITGEKAARQVHILRDRVDAIMVGIETVLSDDPSLTTRLYSGKGRDPLRVILDSRLRTPEGSKIIRQASKAQTWIFCGEDAPEERLEILHRKGAIIHRAPAGADGGLDLRWVLSRLGESSITSLLVEGGGRVHGAFLHEDLYDQACLFFAPVFLGNRGVPVVDRLNPASRTAGKRFRLKRSRRLGDDLMLEGVFSY